MKKMSLADKLAKKSCNSPQFQQSWAVHLQAFGPILEPAFVENYQARVHLCAALNFLSNKNLPHVLTQLKALQKFCSTDEDKTAFLYFLGLYYEMSGDQEHMVEMYTAANEYGHRFYLPYMKVAKFFLDHHIYDRAEENYRSAISCFSATGPDSQDKRLMGSAYTNLATCLTMMHRYDEAEAALATSRSLYPDAPGRAAPEALLHAIRGDAASVDASLAILETHAPDAVASIRESAGRILAREDPLFFPILVEAETVAAFWSWFASYSPQLLDRLNRQAYEEALTPVAQQLLAAFPFLEEIPNISIGSNEQGYVLILQDLYAAAVAHAYEVLLENCPEEIKASWQFDIVHY